MIAGCVGAVNVTELALKAQVNNYADIGRLEFLGIYLSVLFICAVGIYCLEELGEAPAKLVAEPAVCAQLEDSLDLRAQVFFLPKSRVDRVVSRCDSYEESYCTGFLEEKGGTAGEL